MIKLDKRLSMISSLVRKGSRIADVGTDHAYLASFLVESEICPSAVASDINEGPLNNAVLTIENEGLGDKIKAVLSDGLEALEENCADDIVIAGMGGELIASILSKVKWIKNDTIRIIAQPMTHAEDLRAFLISEGFEIIKESACIDGKHCYCAIVAQYNPENLCVPEHYIHYGEMIRNKDEASLLFLENHLKRLKIKFNALRLAGKHNEADEIEKAVNYIEAKMENE